MNPLLKKKRNAVAYHRACEAQGVGIAHIAKEDGDTNLAALFTKLLPGPRLRELAGKKYFFGKSKRDEPIQDVGRCRDSSPIIVYDDRPLLSVRQRGLGVTLFLWSHESY